MKKLLTLITFGLFHCFAPAQDSIAPFDHVDYDRTIKRYFFVELIPNVEMNLEASSRDKIQMAHMNHIKQMTQNGQLVLAGPFQQGGGLFILNVDDSQIAEKLVKNDPSVISGLNTYAIRGWYTEKGLFTLENKKP